MLRTRPLPAALAAVLLLLGLPLAAPAQGGGSVAGLVVSAETQQPIAGAQVVLHASPLGVLAPGVGPRPMLLGDGLSAVTDAAGAYHFANLSTGRYRMYVYALGHRPATLEIRLTGREASQLSVGLRVETVVLERIVITAEPGDPFGTPADLRATDDVAAAAERLRQRRFLASDARALTRSDLQQAVTLGESDLFRALQRLPGVTTRDDYTTELWTRGAPWDQTAVYFDGVPLFNPLHAAGAVSAVNPDAVGAAFFHPGVQPAELASGGAALVDLRTRRGSGGPVRASAELSLLSARAAADGGALDGRLAWMAAARRSHLDVLGLGIRALGGDSTGAVPYGFSDVAARVDLKLGGGARLEASALHEADRLDGEVPGLVREAIARWGSAAGRATLAVKLPGGELRHTLAVSRFSARAGEPGEEVPWRFPQGDDPTTGPYRLAPLRSRMEHLSLGGSWEGSGPRGTQLAAGYRLASERASYAISGLWPARSDPSRDVESGGEIRHGVLWAEAEGDLTPELRAEAGGRAETGPVLPGSGRVRLAPRLSLRYRPGGRTSLSAAAGRTWQYAQALAAAAPGHDGVAAAGVFWTLAGDTVAALRSDVYTLGAERWLGEAVLVSATAYLRDADGVRIPDPREGWLTDRPLTVAARNRARGVDVSLRRLAGRWTGSAAYSYGVSELEAAGERFAAPSGREHTLDLSGMLRTAGELRVGAAYTLASGVHYTRYEWVLEDCGQVAMDGCRFATYARPPGAMRAPAYRSLDLLADWSASLGGWQVGAYAQLRNVLRRENVGAYTASRPICSKQPGASCHPILDPDPTSWDPRTNRFLPGLPFVPLAGVRVAF